MHVHQAKEQILQGVEKIKFKLSSKHEPLKTVDRFNANKLVGTWYVIAGKDNFFKEDMVNVTMTFTLEPVGQLIHSLKTFLSGNKFNGSGSRLMMEGRLKARNDYFSKFDIVYHHIHKSDFFILDFDKFYTCVLAASEDRKNSWILSRTPVMNKYQIDHYFRTLDSQGFDTSQIKLIPQLQFPQITNQPNTTFQTTQQFTTQPMQQQQYPNVGQIQQIPMSMEQQPVYEQHQILNEVQGQTLGMNQQFMEQTEQQKQGSFSKTKEMIDKGIIGLKEKIDQKLKKKEIQQQQEFQPGVNYQPEQKSSFMDKMKDKFSTGLQNVKNQYNQNKMQQPLSMQGQEGITQQHQQIQQKYIQPMSYIPGSDIQGQFVQPSTAQTLGSQSQIPTTIQSLSTKPLSTFHSDLQSDLPTITQPIGYETTQPMTGQNVVQQTLPLYTGTQTTQNLGTRLPL